MVAILTWPTAVPPAKTATWRMVANTQTHISPLDNTVQTLELVGARWAADCSWSGLNEPEWRAFESFLAQLRGAAGRFYFWPPHAWKPRTPIAASPTVVGANQNGTTLLTIGWPPSMTVLNQGDYFAVDNYLGGRELKIIRQPMFTNSGGAVYLTFDPPLRRSPLDGAPIMFNRPTTIMRLSNDEQGAFDHEEGGYASINLQLVEVF
jgi:hypothetical protein